MLTTDAKAGLVTPLSDINHLKKSILVPEEVFDAFLARFGWTWHQVARGEYPAGLSDLAELQLACICQDPVLWAKSFLREPTDPDHEEPYNFFPYQEPSLRYQGHVLHEDGAEVGKTREIVAYTLWKGCTQKGGSGLVGAPLTIYLMEIVDASLDQFSWSPPLEKALKAHRKSPYNRFMFSSGFTIDYRPSDFDGSPYRAVHVRDFAIKDEAAKDKHKKTWSEFYRAAKPGCMFRFYSVPDGDRDCEFYRLCAAAPKFGESSPLTLPTSGSVEALLPSPPAGEGGSESRVGVVVSSAKFIKFNWGKPMMPAPFWSEERRRQFIDLYGGETSPGYQHNVQGAWGDPESSVFPSWQYLKVVKEVPEYRKLKIVVDGARGEVSVYGARCRFKPGEDGEHSTAQDDVIDIDETLSMSSFFQRDQYGSEFTRLIKSFFVPSEGVYSAGADFGYAQDPSEVRVWRRIGKINRVVARLHLLHVDYVQQAMALDALDDLYNVNRLSGMPWGLDYGNAGTAVGQILTEDPQYASKGYDDRLFGFMFGSTLEAVNEYGEGLEDQKTGKPIKLTAKELGTNLLISKIQAQEQEQAPDAEVTLCYTNHTAKEGGRSRIFSKENDHILDADRLNELACVMLIDSGGDFFSCGVSMRSRA